jgi:ATP-dependent HslUV protease ATP-binding subunit HslU
MPGVAERKIDGGVERALVVDRAYVQKQVAGIVKNQDLSRYIL